MLQFDHGAIAHPTSIRGDPTGSLLNPHRYHSMIRYSYRRTGMQVYFDVALQSDGEVYHGRFRQRGHGCLAGVVSILAFGLALAGLVWSATNRPGFWPAVRGALMVFVLMPIMMLAPIWISSTRPLPADAKRRRIWVPDPSDSSTLVPVGDLSLETYKTYLHAGELNIESPGDSQHKLIAAAIAILFEGVLPDVFVLSVVEIEKCLVLCSADLDACIEHFFAVVVAGLRVAVGAERENAQWHFRVFECLAPGSDHLRKDVAVHLCAG